MNQYNPLIHHRRSIRLRGYDYAKEGLYFITICCHEMVCRFGYVENRKMVLNRYGEIAHNEWLKTREIRPNIELGEFVVMPNHFHAIIRILGRGELHSVDGRGELHSPLVLGELHSPNDPGESHSRQNGELHSPSVPGESHLSGDGELHSLGDGELHSPSNGGVCKTPLRGPSQTVGAVVRGYKSAVTKQLGLMGFVGKLWQRNYWEHIIRDESSYIGISDYIINNPAKWTDDKFYEK